jgi:hypothetical protein
MSAGISSKPAYRLRAGTALVAALFAGTGVAHATAAEAATPPLTHSAVVRANPTPPQGLPSDWVQKGSGYFRTADSQDLLHYEVVLNAASPAVVDFRLQGYDRCLWGKTLVMPDGLGSSWDIHIDPSRGVYEDQNGLWAHQVHNGQHLQLWKAGTLGFQYKVLEIGDLGALQPGTRVVFTWLKDSSSCGA